MPKVFWYCTLLLFDKFKVKSISSLIEPTQSIIWWLFGTEKKENVLAQKTFLYIAIATDNTPPAMSFRSRLLSKLHLWQVLPIQYHHPLLKHLLLMWGRFVTLKYSQQELWRNNHVSNRSETCSSCAKWLPSKIFQFGD